MTRSDNQTQLLLDKSLVPAGCGISDPTRSYECSRGPFPLAAVERLQRSIENTERQIKLAERRAEEARKRDNRLVVIVNSTRLRERQRTLEVLRWIGEKLFDNREIDRILDECDS